MATLKEVIKIAVSSASCSAERDLLYPVSTDLSDIDDSNGDPENLYTIANLVLSVHVVDGMFEEEVREAILDELSKQFPEVAVR